VKAGRRRNSSPTSGTEEFTAETVPAGLRKDHCTKAGVWGLIHVRAGRLRFRITDPRRTASDRVLTPDNLPGLVEPTLLPMLPRSMERASSLNLASTHIPGRGTA
jgi:tellurite resistance-related uncharacterized protein